MIEALDLCSPVDALTQRLESEYQETIYAYGADNSGVLLRVYTNPQTGTWTMTVVDPQGESCIISVGDRWRELREKKS